MDKHKEYVAMGLCKKVRRVRRAVKGDKEKWLNKVKQGMEDDMRCHRQEKYFKKMKQQTNSRVTPADSRVTPADTILDESSQPLQKMEEKLACWKRPFEGVLNVHSKVAEDTKM